MNLLKPKTSNYRTDSTPAHVLVLWGDGKDGITLRSSRLILVSKMMGIRVSGNWTSIGINGCSAYPDSLKRSETSQTGQFPSIRIA